MGAQNARPWMLLSDEQHAQGAGAAVAGNGAAGIGFVNGLEFAVLGNSLHDGGMAIVGDGRVSDEQNIAHEILTVSQTLFDIACQALSIVATVFLANAHLAVFNLNAGLQV